MNYLSEFSSPVGIVGIVANDESVIGVAFHPDRKEMLNKLGVTGEERSNQISQTAVDQVEEYFSGKRSFFSLPVSFGAMSSFAASVLNQLADVPFGETRSYGELAAMSGRPQAARAVGRVMGANPVPLIVPCHRVVGSSGRMTGYSGGEGLKTKEWLLAFESGGTIS